MEQRRSFVERAVGATRVALLGVALGVVGVSSHAATITVTSVSDAVNASDGVCTLREAIVAANANVASGGVAGECAAGQAAPTVDTIAFALPGTGVHTIAPGSALPQVTEVVSLDGYTQAGSVPNTQATGGSDAQLRVVIDGSSAGTQALLRLAAGSGGSQVRGLVLQRAQGVALQVSAAGVQVAGNFLGTQADGTTPAPNAGHGIEVLAAGPGMIGGLAAADRNVIAFSAGAGVRIDPAASLWRIVGNVMAGNGKGIALADGSLPRANDVLDADGGPNAGQNFPLIDSVLLTPTSVRVQGRVVGAASRTLILDVYGSLPPLRPTSFLEGERYLGSAPAPIVTDAQGQATFDVTLAVAGTANLWVTATLTDVTGCFAQGCGNTSEFAQRGVFMVLPRWGAGAAPVTVSGQLFQGGSSFAFGATAALGQALVDAQTLTGLVPPLNPGTLYDVTVSHPDQTTATMAKAFVTDFTDVGQGSPFYPFVMSLAAAGITSGCVPGEYCGNAEVSRAQMALFLVRGLYGPFFTPPPATGIFADVPLGSFAVEWIEQFYGEGITSGCQASPLRFCPAAVVTRSQMAVFLLRAKHGSSYVPPPCTGLFADVSCAPPKHPFADWIEQLAREGITSGCAANPLSYCPDASVLRLQMAVFLTRVLGLSAGGNAAPVVNAGADRTITLPAQAQLTGTATDDGLPNPPGQLTYAWTKQSGPGSVSFGTPGDVATSATFGQDGVYVLRLTVSDGALTGQDEVQVTVQPEPPPPVLNPPPIDPTVPTTIGESTGFLHTGPNPVQTGVAPGTIEPRRAAVIRGRVLDRSGAPLPNATVSILHHPQYGQTLTRADGRYDMAVNGGGLLTLDFAASGRLPAQRTVRVPWGEYVNVADVALIPLDGAVTSIAANGATPQVHQGSQQTDASGTRRATILFPPGTGAMMLLPGGVTQPLATLAVRATEYTVGPNGPLAMPGLLPPTSGYTYAVEVSVDQAIAAGASRVQFSQPVPVYVDNFLNFAAGTIVPAGVYDRTAAQWVAMPNGIVAKVVAVAAGAADLDVSGDDLADDPATVLAPLGITLAERQVLATLFAVGASFWRTPVTHFSPLDFNWPYAPPSDAKGAGTEGATTDETLDQCLDEAAGSIIECQNQILGQSVALAGTPYTLNYRSDRVPGREAARTIDVAASGAVVPGSLKRIEVTLSVAGQEFTQALPPVANQRPQVIWDGKDAYGRTVQGRQTFGGTLDYVYDAVYTSPSQLGPAFAQFGGAPITADPARMEFRFPQLLAGRVGIMDARGVGVGGWTLSPHHTYDPDGQVLYHGSGKRLAVGPIPYVTTVVAGSMTADNQEFNNLPATSFALDEDAIGLAAGPDGSFYFTHGCLVRKVDPAGILTVVAGTLQGQNHVCGYGGDGGAATLALLDEPTGLAVAPDGSLYVADKRNHRIRRIDPAGVIRTIAGNGVEGFSGDGGLAVNASIDINGWDFTGVAAGADGSVYFLDRSNARVRRVDPAGIITTIAGGGPQGPLGCQMFEGLPATQGCLFNAQGGVAVAADGTVFVAAFSSVIGVRPDGTAFVAAGDQFVGGSSGDGGLARLARLDQPIALAVGPDGSLYIGDSDNRRIRRVSPGGVITTFAGGGSNGNGDGVDGLPATQLQLNGLGLFGIAVAPDHSVLATQRSTIRRFHPPLPDFLAAPISVASPDGGLLYQFDAFGRHLRTLHALTAAVLHEFGYDAAGRLASVTQKTGATDNVTTIQRNASGHPTAIVGPFGRTTTLAVDANGFVDAITSPAGETHAATFDAGGLMQSFARPGRPASTYQYDAKGRLTRADDPAGGFQTIARAAIATGHEVTRTTALGRATKYTVDHRPTGEQKLTTLGPDATSTVTELFEDGRQRVALAHATTVETLSAQDPRFGMQSPFLSSTSTRLPSSLTLTESGTRSVALADPTNVLSLTLQTDTSSVAGRVQTSAYTAANRTNTVTTPVGRKAVTVLDALGRVASRELQGLPAAAYTYDGRGRIANVTTGTRSATFGYDAQGFLQSISDAAGRAVQYVRDADGRVTTKTVAGVGVVALGYDAAGDLVSITPPGRPAHAFAYDARGNLAAVTPPAVPGSGATTFAYDSDNALTQVARPGGEAVSYGYDASGRVTTIGATSAGGLPATSYAIAYDSAGRIASVAGPGAQTVAHGYDGALVVSTTWSGPFAASATWTYDSAFRVASDAVAGTPAVAYAYDADDLIVAAGSLAIGRSAQTGQVVSMTLGSLVESYSFDAFGELSGRALTAGGAPVYAATYVRDSAGRVTQQTETVGGVTQTRVFAYDVLGQLLQVTQDGVVTETYAYDANGNRTTSTVGGATVAYTHDAQDRMLTAGTTTLAHSPAGKLVSKTAGGATTSYRYDALGNLVDVSLPGGTTIAYRHDGWHRVVQRLVNGAVAAQYVYSGDGIAAELDGAGTVVSRFVYAGGVAPVYMTKGGVDYRFIADGNASVRLVVNASTGAIAQRIDYDAFGRVVLDTNPGFQPFGFAGGLYDPATGLVRMGARDYDASVGRWTSRDPVGLIGGDTNAYRYVRNDPINRMDPAGLLTFDDVLDFASGFLEASAPPFVQFLNPGNVLGAGVDAASRAIADALGYPMSGESYFDRLMDMYDSPHVDRDSAAYALGELASTVAAICPVGGALAGAAARAGARAMSTAAGRAAQAGRNLMTRFSPAEAAAREMAESIASRGARRAQQSAAEQWARDQRVLGMTSEGTGNGTARLRAMDRMGGKILK